MTAFISWYLLISFLGWLTLPLTYRLFPALRDHGYTLSRAFGLLIWGYVFWLAASLGVAQNDMGGLLLGLLVLGGLSAWAILTTDRGQQTEANAVNGLSSLLAWVKENKKLIITTEILFFVTFGFMAIVRAANPEIIGTEKPMELMMIHGTLNSPTFPPRDLWLSGYSISYYHFGYVMTSMLAMFTSVPATKAFNLMIALVFGLSAVGAYGIVYNLLAFHKFDRGSQTDDEAEKVGGQPPVVAPLLAPLFLLFVSNLEGFLEILHRRGVFWSENTSRFWMWLKDIDIKGLFWKSEYSTYNFWTWLDMKELSQAPSLNPGWTPERYWWWWRASRVVQDYELNGTWRETIDEFPAFSFILGDLHPHVLAMPFVLLAVAFALNLFLGGWRGKMNLYFGQLHISKTGFLLIALMLGGLAFLNTWDILIAAALIVFSYALARVREAGWGWERIEDILLLGIPAGLAAYVLYLPFFIGFDSQAGGIIPNFMFVTRGAHLWVMWGIQLLVLLAYVVYLARNRMPANWRAGLWFALGLVLLLVLAMFVLGFLALRLQPDLIGSILTAQGMDANAFVAASMTRRLAYIGSLLTLLTLLIPVLSFLFANHRAETEDIQDEYLKDEDPNVDNRTASGVVEPATIFVLLLIALGTLLILGPDFLYLTDNFGYRINTVFKFYYQAWIVLSIATTYGAVVLLQRLRGARNVVFTVLFVFVLFAGLIYPVLGFANKTNNFQPPQGFTFDDFDRIQRENPDEAAAMLWLRSAPDGVIVEATRPFDAYSAYARVSIYTGLPTVIGWGNHEGQWRDSALQGSRVQDIETLYSTPDWLTAQGILDRYNIRYVYIGNLERTTYRVEEDKFRNFLNLVFQQGSVAIYEVP